MRRESRRRTTRTSSDAGSAAGRTRALSSSAADVVAITNGTHDTRKARKKRRYSNSCENKDVDALTVSETTQLSVPEEVNICEGNVGNNEIDSEKNLDSSEKGKENALLAATSSKPSSPTLTVIEDTTSGIDRQTPFNSDTLLERPLTDEDDEDIASNQENQLITTNDDVARFYSNLSLLASRALLSVKQEPLEMPLAEKCALNFLSNFNGGYYGGERNAVPGFPTGSSSDNMDLINTGLGPSSSSSQSLRPLMDLSPESFAKQLQQNDMASMVVCRTNLSKHLGMTGANNDRLTGSTSRGGGVTLATASNGAQATTSGLQQFATRYTIEWGGESMRSGIEICLEGGDESNPVLEVECGGNKGLLYVKKLCQGSKGESIYFNEKWRTPNEFQFISGRETAKDWKRSIRHCGKSLKTLMTKGVLVSHKPVCDCDYCKGNGPVLTEKHIKKRSPQPPSHDRYNSALDTKTSARSTTPSSTGSTTPLLAGIPESSNANSQKSGREGGLSSIISQLHSRKGGSDVTAGNGEDFLEVNVRAKNTSPTSTNGRKRRSESDRNAEVDPNDESYLPPKRLHGNYDDRRYGSNQKDAHKRSYKHRNNALSNTSAEGSSHVKDLSSNGASKGRAGNCERERGYDLSNNRDVRSLPHQHNSKGNQSTSNSFFNNPYLSFLANAAGQGSGNFGHNGFALLDAVKLAMSNSVGAYPYGAQTPPPHQMTSSSHPGQGGYINLDSTSPRARFSQNHNASPLPLSKNHYPMVELTSPHRKHGIRGSDPSYDNAFHPRNGFDRYDSRTTTLNKASTTAPHSASEYEDYLTGRYSQNGPGNPYSRHHYGMPPPSYNSEGRKYQRSEYPANFRSHHDWRSRSYRSTGKRGNYSGAGYQDMKRRKDEKMLDLRNHVIPMMASKKSELYEKEDRNVIKSDDAMRNGDRKTDSSPPALARNLRGQSRTNSNDEIETSNDAIRRLSSSAPPLPLSGRSRNDDPDAQKDINDVSTKDELKRKNSQFAGSVFDFSKPRAKSVSPLGLHLYCDKNKRSSLGTLPESSVSGDSPFDNGINVQQQSFEMMRWRDLSCAIEDMGEWTVDGVCEFLRDIGCEAYEKVFRENALDGDALPLLTERHLLDQMGFKLGHALKLIARVHRRLGNHCALVSDRFSLSRVSASLELGCCQQVNSVGRKNTDDEAPIEINGQNKDEEVSENVFPSSDD